MNAPPAAACTVVVGQEEFLVERELRRACTAGAVAVEVSEVLAGELSAGQLAEMTSPAMFGDDRVVLLRGLADAGKDVAAVLAAFVADPPPGVRLVASHPGTSRGKALVDALVAAGAHKVTVPPVRYAADRVDFVTREVLGAGGRITSEAAEQLVAAVGTDLRELAAAAAQLAADSGGVVDSEVVARYHRGRAEASGFPVADRVLDGDIAGAMETLQWALSVGTKPVAVTAALAARLRLTARVAAAGRRPLNEVAAAVGEPAWRVKRTLPWVRAWRPQALARAVRLVAAADAEVKGGGADPVYAVTRALIAVDEARGTR